MAWDALQEPLRVAHQGDDGSDGARARSSAGSCIPINVCMAQVMRAPRAPGSIRTDGWNYRFGANDDGFFVLGYDVQLAPDPIRSDPHP